MRLPNMSDQQPEGGDAMSESAHVRNERRPGAVIRAFATTCVTTPRKVMTSWSLAHLSPKLK